MSDRSPSRPVAALLLASGALALAGCELGPKENYQLGPRGAGMEQNVNLARVRADSEVPPSVYELTSRDGPRASELYPELRVLGGISVEEFNLLMANMTEWVVPKDAPPSEAGCAYCHNPENMASYEKYTKTVSLRMLQMTQNINVNWQSHVRDTGVTCYTCHRGQAIPANVWSMRPPQRRDTILGNRHGQNEPHPDVGFSSLPNDPDGFYYGSVRNIRVGGTAIHPGTTDANIMDAEHNYGLMMRISQALGVNCTFCHNTHNFGDWTNSRLQRVNAWHGIRMVREANIEYIDPLQPVFPANMGRLGPMGDPLKINCATCHNGHARPLGGVSMLDNNPALAELRGIGTQLVLPGQAVPPPATAQAPMPGTTLEEGQLLRPAATRPLG